MKTAEEIVKEASNREITTDCSLLELHLYLVITQILKMYFNNQISKEEAVILKKQACARYENNCKQYKFEKEMFSEHIKNIRDTEDTRIKLRNLLNSNEETTEERLCEIIKLCMEIIGTVFKGEFNE